MRVNLPEAPFSDNLAVIAAAILIIHVEPVMFAARGFAVDTL